MAIKAHLHYLLVGKVVRPTLQTHWNSGKNTSRLTDYNTEGLSALTRTFRHTVSFVGGGYLLNVCCMMVENKNPHPVFCTEMQGPMQHK